METIHTLFVRAVAQCIQTSKLNPQRMQKRMPMYAFAKSFSAATVRSVTIVDLESALYESLTFRRPKRYEIRRSLTNAAKLREYERRLSFYKKSISALFVKCGARGEVAVAFAELVYERRKMVIAFLENDPILDLIHAQTETHTPSP